MKTRQPVRVDEEAPTEGFISAKGQKWSMGVRCPKCRCATTEHKARPRWRCIDERCAFHHGWRLDFGVGEPDRLLAIPLDADGNPMPDKAVFWQPFVKLQRPVPLRPMPTGIRAAVTAAGHRRT